MTKATRPVINAAADTVKARGWPEWSQCRCPRVASKDAVVIQSGWVFWSMPSTDGAASQTPEALDSIDGEAVARVLLDRLLELQ